MASRGLRLAEGHVAAVPWVLLLVGYLASAVPLIWGVPYFTDDTDRLVNLPWLSAWEVVSIPSGNDHYTPVSFLLARLAIRLGGADHRVYNSLTVGFALAAALGAGTLLRRRWGVRASWSPVFVSLFLVNSLVVFSCMWPCCILDALIVSAVMLPGLLLAWPRRSQERTFARLGLFIVLFNAALYSGSAAVMFAPVAIVLAVTKWRRRLQRVVLAGGVLTSMGVFLLLRAEVVSRRPAPARDLYRHLSLSQASAVRFLGWSGVALANGTQGAMLGQHSNAVARRVRAVPAMAAAAVVLGAVPAALAARGLYGAARRRRPGWASLVLGSRGGVAAALFYSGAFLMYYGRPRLLPFANEPYYYATTVVSLPFLFASVVPRGAWKPVRGLREVAAPVLVVLALGLGTGLGMRRSGFIERVEENFGSPSLRHAFFQDLARVATSLDARRAAGLPLDGLPDLGLERSSLRGVSVHGFAGCNPHPLSAYSRSLAPGVNQAGFFVPPREPVDWVRYAGHPARWFLERYFPEAKAALQGP